MIDLSGLNPPQREAVLQTSGPVLILAGAGSGKTRALTHRIAFLMDQGVPPWSILAITFTNKAAREMRDRVIALYGERAAEAWIMTFHACCARILRRDIEKLGYQRSFSIYDDDDQMTLIKNIIKELNLNDKQYPPREIKSVISDAKNRLLTPAEWLSEAGENFRTKNFADVFVRYERQLVNNNALDFDDIIAKAILLLAQHPPVLEYYQRRFEYISVDEYQDTNLAQYELVRMLTGERRNICVVGDDDQSIYGWRGADIRNILEFEKDFGGCKVIKLEQNYRSSGNILNAANQVIRNNSGRKEKTLWTDAGKGEKLRVYSAGDERDEAAWLCSELRTLPGAAQDAAVLYRMNAQSRVLEEALVRAGIQYRVYGGIRFYERKEVKDLIAYLRAIVNGNDDVAVARIINEPRRGIGDSTIDIMRRAAAEGETSLLSVALFPDELELPARAKTAVEKFARLMESLLEARLTMEPESFFRHLIEATGYEEQYKQADNEENADRLSNIAELEAALAEYASREPEGGIEGFLENVALVTDLDSMEEGARGVTLMTLHSAKGLEFDHVFLVGLEEGVFPSSRSLFDDDKLEEERRLCYVGMTRARKKLLLSHARTRALYNERRTNDRSRFLGEIAPDLIEGENQRRDAVRLPPPKSSSGFGERAPSATKSVSIGSRTDPLNIPGVTRGAQGFVPSKARLNEAPSLFQAGDRVRHGRFGEGEVVEVSGSGREAKLTIEFDKGGRKQFLADLAPVIKVEG